MNKYETLKILRQHVTAFAEEVGYLAQPIAFVERNDDFWQRSTLEGHLTGSAWVLSADGGSVLLLHHTKLDRWLQPGGHVDETDISLDATASREAREECGLTGLALSSPLIFDIDVHEIPARGHEPAHLHYDLRFLFFAQADAEIERNLLETKDIAWVRIVDLCTETTPQSLRRMALKTLNIERDLERYKGFSTFAPTKNTT